MGHGDDLVIADANFPATALGARCHRLDGLTATEVLQAVLTVLFRWTNLCNTPALVMQVVDDPEAVPSIVAEFQKITTTTADNPAKLDKLERFDFYDRAKDGICHHPNRRDAALWQYHPKERRDWRMIIDAHQHFWQLERGDYGWLMPDLASLLSRLHAR